MRCLITGAGRGIGAALRVEGQSRRHEVIGTHRGADADGWYRLDVTDAAGQSRVAEATGSLDLLVCNAGVYLDKGKSLGAISAEDWASTFATNVTGVALTVQAQLKNLAPGGRIAIISSIMGAQSQVGGNGFVYRASKAAATNFGLNLAQALRPDGIAVGIYHPGWVQTDMGGAEAAVTVQASASGLWDRFEGLDMASSGALLSFDGTPLPI